MQELKGAVVVVTGAGRGLGAALAISLADLGCKLVLCGRSAHALAEVGAIIEARGGLATEQVVLDLADTASVSAALASIEQRQPQIDILINNGAMWLEASEQPHSAAEVSGVINAALTGTFLLTQGLLPALKASSRPDVVTGAETTLAPSPASWPCKSGRCMAASLGPGRSQANSGRQIVELDHVVFTECRQGAQHVDMCR